MLDNSQQRILGMIGSVCVDGITSGVDTAGQQEISASCELYHFVTHICSVLTDQLST